MRKPFVFTVHLEPGHRALEASKVMTDLLTDALRQASGLMKTGGTAGKEGKGSAKKRFLVYFETPKSEKLAEKGKAATSEAKGFGIGTGGKDWVAIQKGAGGKGKLGGKNGGVKGAFGWEGKGGKVA